MDEKNKDIVEDTNNAELSHLDIGEIVLRDRELFDVALYIQDFYFNLINKNFMKAAVYLNLISMSKSLGGVEVEVSQMRRTLIDEAFKSNIKESDLGLLSAEDLVVVEEDLSEEIVAPEMEDLPITYTLGDAIDDVVNEVNLLMLEPMSDEEIDFVTETCQATDCVQSIVIEEEDGSKRVFLRYYDKNGPYVDISGTLRLANYKYKNREYEEAIEYINEFIEYNSKIHGCGSLDKYMGNYDEWLIKLEQNRNMIPGSVPGRVPSETFFLIRESDNKEIENKKTKNISCYLEKKCSYNIFSKIKRSSSYASN